MDQVSEFFRGLFSTSEWPERWHCGYWSDFHGWLYILSDLSIWFAYFMIPVIILRYFTRKKEKIRFQKVYLLFASFILLCGMTHFVDAVMFWYPMYRVNALVRLATGIVSLATVYYMIKILPQFFVQKTNVELENEIALRKLAEEKLEEANKSLAAYASIASHDLQEPLRKISMYSSILQERYHSSFDASGKEYMDKITASTSRMRILIEDILSMSSIQNNILFETVDANKVMASALNDLELKIKEKDAFVEVADLPLIKGNDHYLVQLFYNLIGNALKFSVRKPHIRITASKENGIHWIHVADNGIGIAEADRKQIFDAMKRLHSKKDFEGNGIGLSICKRIADLHQATITVTGNEAGGTTFSVGFPE